MKNEIEFLGMIIDGYGIKLQSRIVEKISVFLDKLIDKKQVQSFLGILNYASDYIENLAKLRKSFQEILKKDKILNLMKY